VVPEGVPVDEKTLRRTDWIAERARLRDGPLDAVGWERLALASYLLAEPEEAVEGWGRAFAAYVQAGDRREAARCAFWAGYALAGMGELARAGAWAGRLGQLAADRPDDPRIAALVALARAYQTADADAAGALLDDARTLAARGGDENTHVLATLQLAHGLVRHGDAARGLALMDDVMLRAESGGLFEPVAGAAFCGVIGSCFARCDWGRAAEWTAALAAWCEAQRGLVPFRGVCLVHEAKLAFLHGRWDAAAALARDGLGRPASPVDDPRAEASRLLGDLERAQGRISAALEHYRAAARAGGEAQPGLALVRLAEGSEGVARAGLERALAAGPGPDIACAVLEVLVRVCVADGDLAAAKAARDDLQEWHRRLDTTYPRALAARGRAVVAAAEGEDALAYAALRESLAAWREIDAVYEAALTRLLLGDACARTGDLDAAMAEFEAARDVFDALGARPDAQRAAERLAGLGGAGTAEGPLTGREREVLALVAEGLGNRAIAQRLFLSERTVARHVGSILAKLGLANRAAATAYAYEHGLVKPGHFTPPAR
jgi:DNA-binding CsgD family transcriptional regulator